MDKDRIQYHWQSTPALWCAIFDDYDGAIDSHSPVGYGKTKEEAKADLRDQHDGYCVCGSALKSEQEQRDHVCRGCL